MNTDDDLNHLFAHIKVGNLGVMKIYLIIKIVDHKYNSIQILHGMRMRDKVTGVVGENTRIGKKCLSADLTNEMT